MSVEQNLLLNNRQQSLTNGSSALDTASPGEGKYYEDKSLARLTNYLNRTTNSCSKIVLLKGSQVIWRSFDSDPEGHFLKDVNVLT